MKKLSILFAVLAALLWGAMCAVVAWNYRAMVCGMEHCGFSAPPNVAFLFAIPFAVAIAVCVVLAIVLRKRAATDTL